MPPGCVADLITSSPPVGSEMPSFCPTRQPEAFGGWPLCATAGAETAHPAGEGDKKLLPTLGAAHPGEAVLEIATVEEFADHRPDDWPPIARALLVTPLVDRLKLRVEPLDQLIEGCLLGLTGMINAAGHLGPTAHDRPPRTGRLLSKRLFSRGSRGARFLFGLSGSFLGARLREERMDLAVQGFHLFSQGLVAGLLAEEHEELADGTVD
jgi:hypothetical protein